MFDMTNIQKRYFDVKLINGQIISVECPKLKTLRKIMDIAKDKEKTIESLASALEMALSKNKQGSDISADWIEENLDMDDINSLLTDYFNWVKSVKNSPN